MNYSYVRVAQLDRASGYGPEGREFESSSARQSSASTRRRVVEALFFRFYFYLVLLQKLGSHLAPSDEGAGERSETEGEKKLRFFVALHLLSLRHGKAVPPPSSEGGENC